MQSGCCLNIKQQLKLYAPFSEKDIWEAIFSIPNAKALGPDGSSSGFFKKSCEVVGSMVSNVVQEFLQTSKMLKQCKATSLVLLPKVQNPNNAREFRPIFCCNVIYKCI